jgi:long-subunit acyl-CoA synthetase (AMP-forming)
MDGALHAGLSQHSLQDHSGILDAGHFALSSYLLYCERKAAFIKNPNGDLYLPRHLKAALAKHPIQIATGILC